ncbi:YqaE/Pmp3 family membrane protein [Flavihumibacter fluvii]|uniref:YqaE/Pmp3 family membrane protein n=1 Tax=Flavihumibacter fluvii TaxID=2838157 RepID=UPI001BDEA64C|nr:YqaE/Pmp3 family membrane protein [Flavihumibacter fluvii]ULQ54409.1 YqaE/Pmp3 family membrane protein [Flavihumibacter fluvii]
MKNLTLIILIFSLLVAVPALKAAETEPVARHTHLTDESAKTALDAAVSEFNALSKKEKKARFRDAKKLIRQYKAEKNAGIEEDTDLSLVLLAIIAILLPPLAVYLKERELTWKFWATLALMVTGIIFLSALPFLWIIAAGLALLVIFDVL